MTLATAAVVNASEPIATAAAIAAPGQVGTGSVHRRDPNARVGVRRTARW